MPLGELLIRKELTLHVDLCTPLLGRGRLRMAIILPKIQLADPLSRSGTCAYRGSEPISRLKFTAVDCGLFFFRISPGSAGGPAQIEGRAQREYHGRAVDLGLKTHAFLGGGQRKVERPAKDDRVQLADIGSDCRVI